ncbi:MAG: MATE family efflux transporter [Myxococcota bacterium]
MRKSRNIDTTTGGLFGKSIQLAWPAVLQALLANFYAFNDFFFVGQIDDPAATAALSACFALLVINYTLLNIVPTGSTTLTAQYIGRKAFDGASDIFRQGLSHGLILSVIVGLGGIALMDQLIAVSNVTPTVGARIDDYLSIIYWSTPLFALMLVVVGAFRACGNTRVPLVLELISLVLNVVLNYVLVIGPGALPSYGIEGAAIATAVSRGLPGLVGLWLIFRDELSFSPWASDAKSERGWRPRWRPFRAMFRIGIFQSLSGFIYGAVYLVLNRMAGEIGPEAQGGLGAGLRGIEWLGFAFGDGFFQASMAVVGQNVGAGKYRRALKGAFINAGLSAVCCQIMGVVFLLFPVELSSVVTDDPATLGYAAEYVGIIGWAMWAVGVEMSLYGALVGAGQTDLTLLVSGGTNLLRVPIAAAALFGVAQLPDAVAWAFAGVGAAPGVTGGFAVIAWTIAGTAVFKATVFVGYLLWRGTFRERADLVVD